MGAEASYINSISRAIRILELYGTVGGELGIQEISRRLGLQKTTVFRIVKTLENANWLVQNPENSKYRLGMRVMHLMGGLCADSNVRQDIILPELTALRDRFNEDVLLSEPTGCEAICTERVRSQNSLLIVSSVGRILPIYCGATAKVFLAYRPREVIDQLFSGELTRYTASTKTDRAQLEEDIRVIREQGYVVSVGEIDEGIYGIGVPVFDSSGEAAFGISICGPIDRIESKNPQEIIDALLAASRRISDQLSSLQLLRKKLS